MVFAMLSLILDGMTAMAIISSTSKDDTTGFIKVSDVSALLSNQHRNRQTDHRIVEFSTAAHQRFCHDIYFGDISQSYQQHQQGRPQQQLGTN
jgi:hypothetical protein